MAYATLQDMIARFGSDELVRLTAQTNEFGEYGTEINQDRIDLALSDASARIDGYLAGRFPLPLAKPLPILNQYACEIARYLLHGTSPLDEVKERNKEAIRYLEKVSEGKIPLGVSTDGERPETMDGATIESAGSVFSRSDKSFI
jgi:phage gp36-like protein